MGIYLLQYSEVNMKSFDVMVNDHVIGKDTVRRTKKLTAFLLHAFVSLGSHDKWHVGA